MVILLSVVMIFLYSIIIKRLDDKATRDVLNLR
jgi:uncharacterized membrane protein